MLLKVLARVLALICAKFDTGNTDKPVGVNSGGGDIDDTKLGDEQRRVYNLMDSTGDNLFITGGAGTGKSFLLQYFVKHTSKQVAVVAPTGVAALNVGARPFILSSV